MLVLDKLMSEDHETKGETLQEHETKGKFTVCKLCIVLFGSRSPGPKMSFYLVIIFEAVTY